MKFAGIVLILTSTTGAGIYFSHKLREKALICRELQSLCDVLIIDVSYRKNSVITLIENNRYSHLGFITPDTVIKKCRVVSSLSGEENARISSFLYSLGKSEAASQLMLIKGFGEYIKRCEKNYNEKYLKNSKMYIAVGAFCGALLGLTVI